MTESRAPASVEKDDLSAGPETPRRTRLRGFRTAIVLFVVFVVLLVFSVLLYPKRAVVHRPAPFGLTMITAMAPVGAFDTLPLTVAPNEAYSTPSDVKVVVIPAGHDLYAVHIGWTYTPVLCAAGQDVTQALGTGCAPSAPTYRKAGSLVNVSLPVGATIVHCHSCQQGTRDVLAERDSTVQPVACPPDACTLTTTTPAAPVTASWDFEVRDTTFAWDTNGVSAEASLPVVSFQDAGNVGYGNVTVTYRIPDGGSYDWVDGPDPDKLSWTEPVSSASAAVQVSGTDNDAADADTRNVLIVGILLGMAGGALVGAIQEFVHAQSDDDRLRGAKNAISASPAG